MDFQSILRNIYNSTRAPQAPAAPQPTLTAPDGQTITPPNLPREEDIRPVGVLETIGHVLAPEAGSFWASAAKNGLLGAKQGQAEYAAGVQKAGLDQRKEAAEVKAAEQAVAFPDQAVGGAIVRRTPEGGYVEQYRPPVQPSEQERLIDQWKKTPEGPLRTLIERAIRGFQYTTPVIEAQGEARTKTVVAREKNRRFAPRAAAASGAAKLPTGAVLD